MYSAKVKNRGKQKSGKVKNREKIDESDKSGDLTNRESAENRRKKLIDKE
jgi:hypothetical protein